MVACYNCESWFHFTCAGVQDSICDKSWLCGYCSTQGNDPGNSAISVSSVGSNARLRLRQLEESKALDDRLSLARAERELAFSLQQAERKRAFLAEK